MSNILRNHKTDFQSVYFILKQKHVFFLALFFSSFFYLFTLHPNHCPASWYHTHTHTHTHTHRVTYPVPFSSENGGSPWVSSHPHTSLCRVRGILPLKSDMSAPLRERDPLTDNSFKDSPTPVVGPTWTLSCISATYVQGGRAIPNPCMLVGWWLSLWESQGS
jgi:hypothetical protein